MSLFIEFHGYNLISPVIKACDTLLSGISQGQEIGGFVSDMTMDHGDTAHFPQQLQKT